MHNEVVFKDESNVSLPTKLILGGLVPIGLFSDLGLTLVSTLIFKFFNSHSTSSVDDIEVNNLYKEGIINSSDFFVSYDEVGTNKQLNELTISNRHQSEYILWKLLSLTPAVIIQIEILRKSLNEIFIKPNNIDISCTIPVMQYNYNTVVITELFNDAWGDINNLKDEINSLKADLEKLRKANSDASWSASYHREMGTF